MAKKKRHAYKNPKAPADKGGVKREFLVRKHANIFTTDDAGDTVKVLGGQKIMLTESMATFYANLGYIEVDLDFGTEKDDEIAKLKAELAAVNAPAEADDAAVEGDGGEAKSGDTADASGGKSGDGHSGSGDAKTAKSSGVSRRKAL